MKIFDENVEIKGDLIIKGTIVTTNTKILDKDVDKNLADILNNIQQQIYTLQKENIELKTKLNNYIAENIVVKNYIDDEY